MPSPIWMGFIRSVGGLNRTKRLIPPSSKKELLLPDCLELGHGSFPAFRLELKHQLFFGLKPASSWTGTYTVDAPGFQTFVLGLELHHLLSWVPSLPTADLGLGLLSLHNHISQFLIINRLSHIYQYIYVYVHTFFLFFWRTLPM